MADKDWDDIPYIDGDCIRDEAEWTDMITYIKHSASVDFTIYDDEDSSNPVFKFSIDGTNDVIEGRTTGNDLKIVGVEGIHNYFKAGEEFKLFDGATEALKVTFAGTTTTIEGGATTGDVNIFKANSIDTYPYVKLIGNSSILYAAQNQFDWNIGAGHIARMKATGGGGSLHLKECTTPAAIGSYGALYTKADNNLYFQDGAGVEHTVTIV